MSNYRADSVYTSFLVVILYFGNADSLKLSSRAERVKMTCINRKPTLIQLILLIDIATIRKYKKMDRYSTSSDLRIMVLTTDK